MIPIHHTLRRIKMRNFKKLAERKANLEFRDSKAMWKNFGDFKNLPVPQLNNFKLQCGKLCGFF